MIRWQRYSYMVLTVAAATSAGCYSETAASGDPVPRIREVTDCFSFSEGDGEAITRQVIELVNLERAATNMGLQPVTLNTQLSFIAESYACRMIEDAFFDHVDPISGHGPGDRALAGKYRFYAIGENLAAGPQTAANVMELWMESPSHREIILDPQWTEVGIGLRAGGEYGTYWVQVFGLPASDF